MARHIAARTRKKIADNTVIIIDVSDDSELHKKLEAWAKKNRRSIDQQILYTLESRELA